MPLNSRQRILLYFLKQSGQPVGRTKLMKWLFLYSRQATNSICRYDFVPYNFGPFSFEAFQDICCTLARFVEIHEGTRADEQKISLRIGNDYEIQSYVARIPTNEQRLAHEIWTAYHHVPTRQLIDLIYSEYPWYASRSILRPRTERQPADIAVYTVGYEGRSVDTFFNHILRRGVTGILDVRRNAFSQKFGFSGHTLKKISSKLEIVYTHLPNLGVAPELRKNLDMPGVLDSLLTTYEFNIGRSLELLGQATDVLACRPTALLCFEAEANRCHRSRLAEKLSELTGYTVEHL